jgi:four helix bundle protein
MYKDFQVYNKAYELALKLHEKTLSFPQIEQYHGIADQLRRSSKSVVANIVEADSFSLRYPKKQISQLQQAIGSKDETILWLRFAGDLKYLTDAQSWIAAYEEIGRMLYGLQQSRKT